jgi:hypothetical protein
MTEYSSLSAELIALEQAYSTWAATERMRAQEPVHGQIIEPSELDRHQHLAHEAGVRATQELLKSPHFRETAIEDADRAADADRRVALLAQAVEGIDGGVEFWAVQHRLKQMLRVRVPLGTTAIGWGLRETIGLRTCDDVLQYFGPEGKFYIPEFIIPEGGSDIQSRLALGKDYMRFGTASGRAGQHISYAISPTIDPIITRVDGEALKTSDMRRQVTLDALRWFHANPGEPLSFEGFQEIVRQTVGQECPKGKFTSACRKTYMWWGEISRYAMPVIQQHGKGDDKSYMLNPDVLPMSVSGSMYP